MIAMQYKINLADDYNMDTIRDRVSMNGKKTDGYKGLLVKIYLIQDRKNGGKENIYCPLYIWKDTAGMNDFLFRGYFDNIINSFGKQNVNIGIVYDFKTGIKFSDYKYLEEQYDDIDNKKSIKNIIEKENSPRLYDFIIYNTDKWKYASYKLNNVENNPDSFEILHISYGDEIE